MSRPNSRNKVVFGVPAGSNPSSQSIAGGGKSSLCVSKTCLKSGATSRKPKFSLPALSVPPKTPPIDPVLEKLRRKTIRRNAPEGEDLKKIKDIIRGLHMEIVTVQEFVGLISPYTGDHGNVLRTVMGDDLSSFRRMAKRVYDTMTQDVSDVLANEQINLTDYYNERYSLYMDKMMRSIDEIYQYAPNFDFELYYEDPKEYLSRLFPLDINVEIIDPEEEEDQRRQEAYHRLQWLRSEGGRFREENDRLQARLKELKKQQQEELLNVRKREEMAELRKTHLEATQIDLQNQLKELDESVEKSFVLTERELRLTEDGANVKRTSKPQIQHPRSGTPVRPPSEPWNVKTAKIIEGENLHSATSAESLATSNSKTGVKKKKAIKSKVKFKKQSDAKSAPTCSPSCVNKSHPSPKEREVSPFHYSPKSPSPCQSPKRSIARGGSPVIDLPVQSNAAFTEQASQPRHCGGRRNLAPKDTWGGFR
ncbi:hypothetical protein ILUMI_00974 [Ignelater luminosus]|uniref:Uncharacterized protein n=1 Tax=Ignelater luminosus TaxID=2038154 RepID=A0A8K0DKX6_IGNLU|nr:hypothetical protein ILUMI_00974 [Ignelater luminosus]